MVPGVKPTFSEGTRFYDREKKVVTKTTEKVRIQGDLKISINGMELPAKLDLTVKAASKVQL